MKDFTSGQGDDFKGNFNFSSLLEKNEKKTATGPISSLLQSTTQTVIDNNHERNEDKNKDSLFQKIEELERRFETKEVNEKFERLESLLQSVIINQANQKQIEFKEESTLDKKGDNSKNILMASIILSASLLISVGVGIIFNNKVTPIKNTTPKLTKEIIKFHTPTKYLNLRSLPSTKGNKLLVVAPNTRVEILGEEGEWIQIKFKDYLKNTIHTGWIYDRSNLKSI